MTRLSCHTPAPHVPDETSHFGPLKIELSSSILSGKSQGASLVEMSRTLFGCVWRIVISQAAGHVPGELLRGPVSPLVTL
jgi:hypothetical protein